MNVVLTIIKTMRVTDIIDILIVSLVIYRIYGLINYTRAIQLMKGVGLILVLWRLSAMSGLRMVNFFLEKLLTFGALAVVIVFQPEIRRALEYIGRNKLISRSFLAPNEEEVDESIEEIVTAVSNLSRKKTGALLVLEGDTGLQDIIETGTEIHASIKASLLENIFVPKAPLHDGATILKRNLIVAAGCLLPLSNDRNVSRDLGTRHRAALGMSANSDALVVVVSEETGIISVARSNDLQRFITLDQLREIIREFYSEDKSALRRIFRGGQRESTT